MLKKKEKKKNTLQHARFKRLQLFKLNLHLKVRIRNEIQLLKFRLIFELRNSSVKFKFQNSIASSNLDSNLNLTGVKMLSIHLCNAKYAKLVSRFTYSYKGTIH